MKLMNEEMFLENKKTSFILILLTGLYFILFCSHFLISLLDNEPFHSFKLYYALILLFQSLNLLLHRKMNEKYYNKYILIVVITFHFIETVFFFLGIILLLLLYFSTLRFIYLVIGIFQSVYTIFFLMKFSNYHIFNKIYDYKNRLGNRISYYMVNRLNNDSNENLNNMDKFHLTITKSTFNPLNIKLQDNSCDFMDSNITSVTIKSCNYSQEDNYAFSNNNASNIDYSSLPTKVNNTISGNDYNSLKNIIPNSLTTISSSATSLESSSVSSVSPLTYSQASQLLSPITQSTEPSHVSSLITPSVQITQTSSSLSSFSTPPSYGVSTNLSPLASPPSDTFQPKFNKLSTEKNNDISNTKKNATVNIRNSVIEMKQSPTKQPNKKNKKVPLLYKIFLFVYQLFYLFILIIVIQRSIINYSDSRFLNRNINGQKTTTINTLPLHIKCLGQGPITVLFESGLFISSNLLWNESFQRISNFTKSCIYDRAGYGWSEMGSFPRNPEQEEKELTELLKQSNLDGPYLLISHSYGSLISTSFASHNKDKVIGMILVEPFFYAPNFNENNYLLNNFNKIKNVIYWSGFNTALSIDILSIPQIENEIGLSYGILSENIEKRLIRNTNLFKTVYSEIISYNKIIDSLNQTSMDTLRTNIENIPTRIIIGDQTMNDDLCYSVDGVCNNKKQCNENYQQLLQQFCNWENCKLVIAENSGHYVSLDRLDIIVTSIYEFLFNI